MRSSYLWLCAAALVATTTVARAQTVPFWVAQARFYSFPGAFTGAPSALSTGRGLSDRWLGDEPFDNPAAGAARGVMVAPEFLRVKRQDLLNDYDYTETDGSVDLAGGWLSLPVRGLGVALYAYQPVLRLEDATYVTKVDPSETVIPFTLAVASRAREWRAGLALSCPWRGARFGLAVERTQRDDSYDFNEVLPVPERNHLDFSGAGFGFQAGARVPIGSSVVLGGALRRVPQLDLDGTLRVPPTEVDRGFTAAREAGWEGGLSARWAASRAFRTFASVGGRTSQEWAGLGVADGRSVSLGAGLEYEEPEQPWAFRFGIGQEQQSGALEPRANYFALGVGWQSGPLRADLGGMRRSLAREGRPASYDDRVVAGLTVGF